MIETALLCNSVFVCKSFSQACQPEFSKNLETQHASQESQQKLMFASPGFTFVFFLTIHSTFMQFHACVPW